jgi:hypothetical protein
MNATYKTPTNPSPALLQLVHKMEVKITRGAEGRTGKAFVADMTEERALDLASKFVSEGFLYGVRHVAAKPGRLGMLTCVCAGRSCVLEIGCSRLLCVFMPEATPASRRQLRTRSLGQGRI